MGQAAAVVGIGTAVNTVLQEKKSREAASNNEERYRAELDDLGQRREATYRNSRQGLQGAIEDFYKQKGWELPKKLPGAYTTRGLPGEAPLYGELETGAEAGEAGQSPTGNRFGGEMEEEEMPEVSSPSQIVPNRPEGPTSMAPAPMMGSGYGPDRTYYGAPKPKITPIAELPMSQIGRKYGY